MASSNTKKGDSNDRPPVAIYLVARIFDLFDTVVRFGCIPLFFWLCVRELAGQKTVVDVVVNYFSKGGNIAPWALGGATSVWAYGERKLRQVKTARMSRHINDLEKRLDPTRTSSGLTPTGQTPKPGRRQRKQESRV